MTGTVIGVVGVVAILNMAAWVLVGVAQGRSSAGTTNRTLSPAFSRFLSNPTFADERLSRIWLLPLGVTLAIAWPNGHALSVPIILAVTVSVGLLVTGVSEIVTLRLVEVPALDRRSIEVHLLGETIMVLASTLIACFLLGLWMSLADK